MQTKPPSEKGGSASYLKARSQDDYARRYGLFLGFLKIKGALDRNAAAAAQVTPENIKLYLDDLTSRVKSVTAWNSISMVRRAAQFIAPSGDFSWLREIDNDLAFVMQPKSKLDRFVLAERLAQSIRARCELRETIASVREIAQSEQLKSIMNARHKHIAHSLTETKLERRGPILPMKIGDETNLIERSIPIVERLYCWVNGTSFSIRESQRIDQDNAEALWKGCTFSVLR